MKTKTMYICKADLGNYRNLIMSEVKEGRMDFEVQISWQEPEKKIEITESEFNEAIFSFFKLDENNTSPISRGVKMQEHLRQKLFWSK